MSRSRNKYTNHIYYLFKTSVVATENTNEIENTTNEIGVPFLCDIENKVKGYRDAMTGVWQSTTVKRLKTMAQLDFAFGDLVSSVSSPSDDNKEFVQTAFEIDQSTRGGKHSNKPITEWVIEVS